MSRSVGCSGQPCIHGSRTRLGVGKVLAARPTGGSVWVIEREFDRLRPADKPSRLRSWFLSQSREAIAILGAAGNPYRYFYEVEPMGPVHRGDFGWMANAQWELFESLPPDTHLPPREYERKLTAMARGYWQGKPAPRAHQRHSDRRQGRNQGELWEWHTPKVRVVREVKAH